MKTPIRAIRMTEERWTAYRLLLGNAWLYKQIDRAIAKEQRKPTATRTEE